NNNPHILTGAFLLILIANFIMFGLGALGARVFARILSMPEPVLMGFILLFSLVGAFVVRGNAVDILICVTAGVAGVILRFARYPVAPIVIGMALGKTFEGKLRQGMISAQGDFVAFLSDPIALAVLGVTVLVILGPLLRGRGGSKTDA
ncbi:MAG: tripartite tricarboxylate transporter permease, partial [Pirellulales bacterium]|nr:tripartite tricarboxylate transporter permease [Pirellulales bacterium]